MISGVVERNYLPGVGWENLEWSPWFVVKFSGTSKKFKILRFKNLLPKRLCRAATTKPRQIERSGFFLLDHNGKTWIYRLIPGSFDVPLRRKTRFSDGVWWLRPPPWIRAKNDSSGKCKSHNKKFIKGHNKVAAYSLFKHYFWWISIMQ